MPDEWKIGGRTVGPGDFASLDSLREASGASRPEPAPTPAQSPVPQPAHLCVIIAQGLDWKVIDQLVKAHANGWYPLFDGRVWLVRGPGAAFWRERIMAADQAGFLARDSGLIVLETTSGWSVQGWAVGQNGIDWLNRNWHA